MRGFLCIPRPDHGIVGTLMDCAIMVAATLSPNAHIACEEGPKVKIERDHISYIRSKENFVGMV